MFYISQVRILGFLEQSEDQLRKLCGMLDGLAFLTQTFERLNYTRDTNDIGDMMDFLESTYAKGPYYYC